MKKENAQRPSLATRLVRAGVLGVVSVVGIAGTVVGCLDRPICPDPDHPNACSPQGKNVFVATITQSSVDKIDLLFMIDNSASMADKQKLLGDAVPKLVNRLVNPVCVNRTTGAVTDPPADPDALCPQGSEREFSAIKDIHIGVVTSSLGGHGATICTPTYSQWNPTQDDKGHLVGLTRAGLNSYQNQGFLAWDPSAKYTPPGASDATQFSQDFTNMVKAAGESGCGYEAILEAWYRFLVDPNPPDQVSYDDASQSTVTSGTDTELLQERANFLRPDSLLAVVMLADENDCSVADRGLGWLVGRSGNLPSPTSTCASNPNDKCCYSCGQGVPQGCTADPVCTNKKTLTPEEDSINLRCWDQKRRFGIATDPAHPEAGMLYPTQRYSNALKSSIICPDNLDLVCRNGQQGQPNPIFSDIANTGRPVRGPDLVFLAGIVGVPWHDIATDDTRDDPAKLTYLSAEELTATGRWDDIVGDPTASPPVPPKDPLMIESVDPRTGQNPVTKDALVPPGPPIPAPNANPINGHEWTITDRGDLQYACIFPLDTPTVCDGTRACDCDQNRQGDKPLCQDPNNPSAPPGTTQYYAKAYPGLRELQVLKEFGNNSIVASICPKIQDPGNVNYYGYNPAVAAIIERLKSALSGKCLPRVLDVDAQGQVPCAVVEALGPAQSAGLDCGRPGRIDLATVGNGNLISEAVKKQLKTAGVCDAGANTPSCAQYLLCEINQFDTVNSPAELTSCQNDDVPNPSYSGYCYVADNQQGQHIGNPTLLEKCSPTEKQLLRFVGGDANAPLPAPGATYFIACTGASFATGGGAAAP
ncbi:MAG: hypothetical protein OZ921_12955 [Sorangiineae bacterium]|nr:hypothetical protein [Polyangiaceae bacterium]MEB2323417.1 hypothetical protein [Sorangiineae bacterium]